MAHLLLISATFVSERARYDLSLLDEFVGGMSTLIPFLVITVKDACSHIFHVEAPTMLASPLPLIHTHLLTRLTDALYYPQSTQNP